MKAIIMPKFGFTHEEAEIVRWIKHDGDAVRAGEPIAEVTTDKVNMEVEAPEDGTLGGIAYKEGDIVKVTTVIAYVLKVGESAPAQTTTAPTASVAVNGAASVSTNIVEATPIAQRIAREQGIDLAKVKGSGAGGKITREDVERSQSNVLAQDDGRVRATPAARRISQEQQVALADIKGSGPRGRVQAVDVLAATASVAPVASAPTAAATKTIPFVGMRRTIATRLQQSYQELPHITFDADVDVTAAEALRARTNANLREGQFKVSLTAIIAKVCAWALRHHPLINSRLDLQAQQIVMLDDVNVGVAVALKDGLIVPVIRNADQKGILQIAAELTDLAERAKSNKLKPDDVQGGTFSISNLGMYGVDRFTAIINPPEVAILAVGATVKRFVPDAAGQPVLRPMMTLRLSADHRVVDGAVAAQFIADVRRGLETPERMLL